MLSWLKGNRTRIVGALIAILGVVEMYAREVIPADYQGLVLMSIGILMIVLRQVTDTPPGKAAKKAVAEFRGENV
jgi:membrane-bound ClpP family serine protease